MGCPLSIFSSSRSPATSMPADVPSAGTTVATNPLTSSSGVSRPCRIVVVRSAMFDMLGRSRPPRRPPTSRRKLEHVPDPPKINLDERCDGDPAATLLRLAPTSGHGGARCAGLRLQLAAGPAHRTAQRIRQRHPSPPSAPDDGPSAERSPVRTRRSPRRWRARSSMSCGSLPIIRERPSGLLRALGHTAIPPGRPRERRVLQTSASRTDRPRKDRARRHAEVFPTFPERRQQPRPVPDSENLCERGVARSRDAHGWPLAHELECAVAIHRHSRGPVHGAGVVERKEAGDPGQ